jgi:hypothetical protein
MENKIGDKTLPSLSPVLTTKSSVTPDSNRSEKVLFSKRECKATPNFLLTPNLANLRKRRERSTEGKADLKSMRAANMGAFFPETNRSKSLINTKTASSVPERGRKPN